MVRLLTYVSCSAIATALTLTKYALQYKQFYPTVVHIVNSPACNLVLGNFAVAMLLTFATLLKWAFLNSLRDIEFENMQDRLWVTIMDTLLAMTIFHDEFGYLFFFLFGGLLACKVFHWLASDRVDYVASGTVHGLFAHVRLSALMFSLLLWDVAAFYYCGSKVWRQPPSVMILFAFEYCLLTISMIGMLVKYALNCYDLTLDGQWESKGVIILYMDFFVDIIQLLVYVIFFVSLFRHYGIPLHLVRQIWLTFQSFWKRVTLVMRYIRATSDVDTRFPEATPEQLANADVCVVCRDGMETGRVLRCGHIMHRRCLLTWLEHSQTCPHCRESVFDDSPLPARNQMHQQAWQQRQFQDPEQDHAHAHQPQPVPQVPQQWPHAQQAPHAHHWPAAHQAPLYTSPTEARSEAPMPLATAAEQITRLQDQLGLLQDQMAYMQEQLQVLVSTIQTRVEEESKSRTTTTTTTTTSTVRSTTQSEQNEEVEEEGSKDREEEGKKGENRNSEESVRKARLLGLSGFSSDGQ